MENDENIQNSMNENNNINGEVEMDTSNSELSNEDNIFCVGLTFSIVSTTLISTACSDDIPSRLTVDNTQFVPLVPNIFLFIS